MAKTVFDFNPEDVGREQPGYWGAVLAMALEVGDTAKAEKARAELRRLGIDIAPKPRKAVPRGR